MIKEWRRLRAVARVTPGDGRKLKRFRWWQLLRAPFHLPVADRGGRPTVYAVDVRHWQNRSCGDVKAPSLRRIESK
ncbi:hypothetical protein [Embleya sp. NBC_00888]|uniref:hypothetical protein n=1 Tax=Embleya sp. NBC_00888 TaxID=2975960 RepID=UPI002F9097F9